MATQVGLHRVRNGRNVVWMLRWTSGRKRCGETLGRVDQLSKREAVFRQRAKQADFAKGTQSPNRPDRMTLRQFIADYPDRRRQAGDGKGYLRQAPKLSEKTITDHLMSLRYLVSFFGDAKPIDRITLADASEFVDALAGGKLGGARKKSRHSPTLPGGTMRLRLN